MIPNDAPTNESGRPMTGLEADYEQLRIAFANQAEEIQRLNIVNDKVGFWLSAALDDPNVCEEMKEDIREWFEVAQPLAQQEQSND